MQATPGNSNVRTALYCCAATLLVFAPCGQLRAGEAYYVLVFASQRTPNAPDHSHTSATFVRATWPGDGPAPPSAQLEAHTISWLPRALAIHALTGRPEPGHNFGLAGTFRVAGADGEHVLAWGPYQIQAELYGRALRQIALLESGRVLYKANDAGHRSDHVSNCIHAVSSVAEGYRRHLASPGWGEPASRAVLHKFRPWLIEPSQTHPWVASGLGLDAYSVTYRDGEFLGRGRRRAAGGACGCGGEPSPVLGSPPPSGNCPAVRGYP